MNSVELEGPRIWLLTSHPLYTARQRTIDWVAFLPPNFGGTKHEREYLRKSAKGFMRCWIEYAEARRGVVSPGSIGNMYRQLKTIISWMTSNGIFRFSALSEKEASRFLRQRAKIVGERRGVPYKGLTKNSLHSYYAVLQNLWLHRSGYVAPLGFDPSTSCAIGEILQQARDRTTWRPLELDAALTIIRSASAYIEVAPSLLSVSQEIWMERAKWVGLSTGAKNKASARFFARLAAKNDDFLYLSSKIAGSNLKPAEIFWEAVRAFWGASILVFLFFTGMRIGELLALDVDCLERRTHSDGVKYWYVNGIAAKANGMRRKWVVPDVLVEAINYLVALCGPLRQRFDLRALFVVQKGGGGSLAGRSKPLRMKAQAENRLARYFIANYSGEEVAADARSFHAHRARKTFATFVAMRNKSALQALAHHFGHLYAAMLDEAYVGSDFELTQLISEQDQRELADGLRELLSAESLGGKAGERLSTMVTQLRQSKQFQGQVAVETLIGKLLKDGVTLVPCDWGYCVYAKDLSLCEGGVKGPNRVRRAPSICASCSNFAVTEKQLFWWNNRSLVQEKFLDREDLSEQARRITEYQLEFSRKVLKSLVNAGCKEKDDC